MTYLTTFLPFLALTSFCLKGCFLTSWLKRPIYGQVVLFSFIITFLIIRSQFIINLKSTIYATAISIFTITRLSENTILNIHYFSYNSFSVCTEVCVICFQVPLRKKASFSAASAQLRSCRKAS